jgi:hypothetical protein
MKYNRMHGDLEKMCIRTPHDVFSLSLSLSLLPLFYLYSPLALPTCRATETQRHRDIETAGRFLYNLFTCRAIPDPRMTVINGVTLCMCIWSPHDQQQQMRKGMRTLKEKST